MYLSHDIASELLYEAALLVYDHLMLFQFVTSHEARKRVTIQQDTGALVSSSKASRNAFIELARNSFLGLCLCFNILCTLEF